MSLRPVQNTVLGSGGGDSNRLRAVLAVGTKKANGPEKNEVDIFDGDILEEVKRQLVKLRKGTREVYAKVKIVQYQQVITMSYIPNVPENIIPIDSLEHQDKMFYMDMKRTTDLLFPTAPMANLAIYYDRDSKRLTMQLMLQRRASLNKTVAKRLTHAFVAGVTNQSIGTRCYKVPFDLSGVAAHLPLVLSDSVMQGVEVPYFVDVVVRNTGDCASNRRIGN
jgi:hypothetical protein